MRTAGKAGEGRADSKAQGVRENQWKRSLALLVLAGVRSDCPMKTRMEMVAARCVERITVLVCEGREGCKFQTASVNFLCDSFVWLERSDCVISV